MELAKKVRQIREAEGLTREEFAVRNRIPYGTLLRLEQGKSDPRASMLIRLCHSYPKYALWLVSGRTQPEAGHIRPDTITDEKSP